MPQNAQDIRIAITGKVLTAAANTAGPGDCVAAWPSPAFTDHGFTDPSGLKITPKPTTYDVKAWQAFSPVRTRIVERIREVQFILLQTGGLNTRLYEGGGTWTGVPTRSVADGVLNGTTTVTSATAAFVAGDVGASLVGPGIPAGATITVRVSGTQVTISAAATMTASGVSLTIGGAGTAVFTPPTPGVDDVRTLGLEFQDGLIVKRFIFPTAEVINVGTMNLSSGKEASYDITMRILGDVWSELSNDVADQPATLAA